MLTLWQLSLLIGDGLLFVYDSDNKWINVFNIGAITDISDFDGIGGRIVDKFERLKEENNINYSVILSAEIDENENGNFLQFI